MIQETQTINQTSFTPTSLKEALDIRAMHKAQPFAGGTDLMVEHFIGSGTLIQFEHPIVFLNGIRELNRIEKKGNTLIIGSMTPFYDIINHSDTPQVLKEAASGIAGPPIRNIATIGGNICNASPSADSLPALYALNAELTLQSQRGQRIIPISDFIVGVAKTTLAEDEILTHITIPLETYEKAYYRKIGTRKANALSKLAFCALVINENNKFRFRITFCTMAITITRDTAIEEQFAVADMSEWKKLLPEILEAYSTILNPRDSARSTAQYRKKTALNLIKAFFESL